MKMKFDFLQYEEKFWYGLAELVFRFTFIGFAVLLAIDYLVPGFVTNWLNPIWLLIIAIISAIILITKK
ncbi:MAG: hypothetical protein CMI53_03130 [Parcubacteria group bacterium]|jgi:hypothetical protein|nr:hypothetical protein [Parcubacteria group bacterium]